MIQGMFKIFIMCFLFHVVKIFFRYVNGITVKEVLNQSLEFFNILNFLQGGKLLKTFIPM